MCFRSIAGQINSEDDSSASSLFDSDYEMNAPPSTMSAFETGLLGLDSDLTHRESLRMRQNLDLDSGSVESSESRNFDSGSDSDRVLHASEFDSDRRVRRRYTNYSEPGIEADASAEDTSVRRISSSVAHRGRDVGLSLSNYSNVLKKGHTSCYTLKGIWYCNRCAQSLFCGLTFWLQVWGRP